MICFNIFYRDTQTVIEIDSSQTVFELKAIVSSALDYEYEDVVLFLVDYGLLDSEDYNELPLLALGIENSRSYLIIVFDNRNLNKLSQLCCSEKIIGEYPVTQAGFMIKEKISNKSLFPICGACGVFCHENAEVKEELLENGFFCMCKLGLTGVSCKFNLCDIKSSSIPSIHNMKSLSLTNINSLLVGHSEKLYMREKKKIDDINKGIMLRDFDFEKSIKFGLQRVLMYEDAIVQECVTSIIPLDEMKKEAADNSLKSNLHYDDELVKSLLSWFGKRLFKWCDKPICQPCNLKSTTQTQTVPPNEDEKIWLASRTEVYSCDGCNSEVRFARYNNPMKLCETRTGRCGEYANLFGCILRCLGYSVRFVDNFEDHVWNEYYSNSLCRWIHIDSCENAWDTPLMYEQGWGRNMTFILAHSAQGIYDVTRRYVKDWDLIASRRQQVQIEKLNFNLSLNNNNLREKLEPIAIENLAERDLTEQLELLKLKSVSEAEMIGRLSGSEEWRKDRGEIK